MKKILVVTVVLCALIGLGLGQATLGNGGVKDDQPGMMVSPQTIVLAKVDALTVHTNIPEASVADGTVTLDGVSPLDVWADDEADHSLGREFRQGCCRRPLLVTRVATLPIGPNSGRYSRTTRAARDLPATSDVKSCRNVSGLSVNLACTAGPSSYGRHRMRTCGN